MPEISCEYSFRAIAYDWSSLNQFNSFFLLIVFSMTLTMKAFFRTLAAAFATPAPAQTFAGLSVLTLVLYTGYTIPQPSMIGALKWITYINVCFPKV